MKLIPKDAVLAEIDKVMAEEMKFYETACKEGDEEVSSSPMVYTRLQMLRSSINSLEGKEVDLQEEVKRKWDSFSLYYDESRGCDVAVWPFWVYKQVCKYFFKLGVRVNNPITAADRGTAEEIIINLKRVEQDYRINLTKEMEWLRNKVKKGE